mmetsp:Transcript_28755/g.54312  ORF Transcript_28755/g.54312 Transcript_28755/m.54312 type:complete len:318 (-) Transcript_28755:1179-2132(-)
MAMSTDMAEDNANAPQPNEEEANDLIADTDEDEPSSNNDGRLFRCFELVGVIALFAIALVVEFVAMPQHIRAIPVQTITSLQKTTTTTAASSTSAAVNIHVRNLLFDEALNEATMGTVALVFVALLLPLCLQLAMTTSWCNTTTSFSHYRRRPFDRYNTLCSYLVAISLTFLIVDILKLYCGYLRPHFYEVCMPDDANYEYCTNENENEVREVRLSFPSGHAGLSMSGLGSFSMYLYHRFGVGSLVSSPSSSRDKANTRAHRYARLWSFLAVAPVLVALFIGASRIHDNHHHPVDVVGGWAIGGVAAYFCHHVWFLD